MEAKRAESVELKCPHCGKELIFEPEPLQSAELQCPACKKTIKLNGQKAATDANGRISADDFSLLTGILEYCRWDDAESAITQLGEVGEKKAVPFIQPFLYGPHIACYKAALVALEKLQDEKLLDHVLLVLSDDAERLPDLLEFLKQSPLYNNDKVIDAIVRLLGAETNIPTLLLFLRQTSLHKHNKVIGAVAQLLTQKDHLHLLLSFLDQTELHKHDIIVSKLMECLRDKELDEIETEIDPRKELLQLLGKTENPSVLPPLFAHTESLSPTLRYQAIVSLIKLKFDSCESFLLNYLQNKLRLRGKTDVMAGVSISEFLARAKSVSMQTAGDAIEAFCRMFEKNSNRFPEIAEDVRRRLKTVMQKIGRKYPGGGVCFIATAAYGSELEPEVQLLRIFRDTKLRPYKAGRFAIDIYERFSPALATWVARKEVRKHFVKHIFLKPIIGFLSAFYKHDNRFSNVPGNP